MYMRERGRETERVCGVSRRGEGALGPRRLCVFLLYVASRDTCETDRTRARRPRIEAGAGRPGRRSRRRLVGCSLVAACLRLRVWDEGRVSRVHWQAL